MRNHIFHHYITLKLLILSDTLYIFVSAEIISESIIVTRFLN